MTRHPARPERLYLQNHGGVYRSDDEGGIWKSIADGLPAEFGFPIVVHPHEPDTVYVFPLNDGAGRYPPDGKARVWRSRDAGETWEELGDGAARRLLRRRDARRDERRRPRQRRHLRRHPQRRRLGLVRLRGLLAPDRRRPARRDGGPRGCPVSQDVVAAASAALGRELRDLGGLGGSDRSGVHRAADGAGTVVVKSYAGGSRLAWARERVGLAAAGPVGVAPRLLAVAADPPLVVMEDLGSAPGVADHLLGADPVAADDALVAWATALGRLHAGTHADRAAIARAFAEAESAVATTSRSTGSTPASTAASTRPPSSGPRNADELGWPGRRTSARWPRACSTPSTMRSARPMPVPDNNLLADRGLHLIDFEWSEVRHPAWDAAYLAVPWPTCWCSWRIPAGLRRPGARRLPPRGGAGHSRTSPPTPSRSTWPPHGPAGRWSRCRGPLTTALREEQTPAPAQPRHPTTDAAPARSLVAESGTARGVVRGRGARAHPAAVG